jgi:predicted AlkP superfamily pyrophosphatase or phosphodiesterase
MMKYYIVIDIVGLEFDHLQSGIIPNISQIASEGECAKMEPVFPSVTCTVQASLLSGTYPSEHGIISNGLYDRTNHNISFWEQSSNLVKTDRVWDIAKKNRPKAIKTAVLFWQNTMYCNANIVVTPRPIHFDNGMVMWCYSKPVGYYDQQLKTNFGEFNLSTYWGPFASHKSSEWISQATTYTLEEHRPNLLFTYIPHIDYSAQRFGKRSSQVKDDLKIADGVVQSIFQKTIDLGIKDESQLIILSEYGFNEVSSAIPLNLKLRDAGLLAARRIQDKEYLDYEFSNAFAMVDHQLAHVYVKDGFADKAKHALEDVTGVDRLLYGEEKKLLQIDHERSGDIIAISDQDKWFSYYWCYEPEMAPSFAKNVDIHRKPGYDPVELFIDPKTRSISQDTSLVKGSHGRPANLVSEEGLALYLSNRKSGILRNNNTCDTVKAVDIGKYLKSLVS